MSHPSNIVPALAAIEDLIANLVKVRSRIRTDSDSETLTSFIATVVAGTRQFVRAHETKLGDVRSPSPDAAQNDGVETLVGMVR